jgi:hypothetical protein
MCAVHAMIRLVGVHDVMLVGPNSTARNAVPTCTAPAATVYIHIPDTSACGLVVHCLCRDGFCRDWLGCVGTRGCDVPEGTVRP